MFEHLVVVHGMPAAGKTWLSTRLAPVLGYPLLARDAIKEAMYDALEKPNDVDDLAWSRYLGERAFPVFLRIAPSLGPKLVLDAHFQKRFGESDEVRALAPHATQIYVHAQAAVILKRFEDRRGSQHPCHAPYPMPSLTVIENDASHFTPLDLDGPTLKIDTSRGIDVESVAEWVRQQQAPNA